MDSSSDPNTDPYMRYRFAGTRRDAVDLARPGGVPGITRTTTSLGNIAIVPTSATQPPSMMVQTQEDHLFAPAQSGERALGRAQEFATAGPAGHSTVAAELGISRDGLSRSDMEDNVSGDAVPLQSLVLKADEYACFELAPDGGTPYGGVFLWVYLPQALGSAMLVSKGDSARGRQLFCLKFSRDRGLCATVNDEAGNERARILHESTDLMDNAWHLVGFTVGPTDEAAQAQRASGLRLYVDGMEVAAQPYESVQIPPGNLLCVNRNAGDVRKRNMPQNVVPRMSVSNLTYWSRPLGAMRVAGFFDDGGDQMPNPLQLVADRGESLKGWWKLGDRQGARLPSQRPGAREGHVLTHGMKPVQGLSPEQKDLRPRTDRGDVYAKQWRVVGFARPGAEHEEIVKRLAPYQQLAGYLRAPVGSIFGEDSDVYDALRGGSGSAAPGRGTHTESANAAEPPRSMAEGRRMFQDQQDEEAYLQSRTQADDLDRNPAPKGVPKVAAPTRFVF